eukprot:207144-Chlamydomonas_euryale.AAC.11
MQRAPHRRAAARHTLQHAGDGAAVIISPRPARGNRSYIPSSAVSRRARVTARTRAVAAAGIPRGRRLAAAPAAASLRVFLYGTRQRTRRHDTAVRVSWLGAGCMVGPILAAACMAASPGARGAAPLLALLRQQLFGPSMHAHACAGAFVPHARPTPAPTPMLRLSTSAAGSIEGGAGRGVEAREAAASPPAEAATPAGADVAAPVLAHRPPEGSSSGYLETVEASHRAAELAQWPHNKQVQLPTGPGLQLTAAEQKVRLQGAMQRRIAQHAHARTAHNVRHTCMLRL